MKSHARRLGGVCALSLAVLAFVPPAAARAQSGADDDKGLRPEPKVASPMTDLGWRDFRGNIHSHSFQSHDSTGTVEEIRAACKETGLDFLCMTDHATDTSVKDGLRGWIDDTLHLPGEEIGANGGGSILTINAAERTHARDPAESARVIHQQGGLLIAGHAEDWTAWDADFDAIELYNIHYDTLLDGKMAQFMMKALPKLRSDPDAAFRNCLDRPDKVMASWDALCQKRRVPAVAGNDSHQNVKLAGVQVDPYARSYGFVNTHVFVKTLTEASLLDAIRQGRAYICHETLHPGEGFSFLLRQGENGPVQTLMGEERTFRPGLVLDVRLPVSRPMTIYRNGELWTKAEGASFQRGITEPGVYRVEAGFPDNLNDYVERPWIYSNPIYVRPAAATPPADDEEF